MIEYSLLDVSRLGADAQKALGSAPGKMMAARGMAPIASPVDLAAVLYQLCLDSDSKIAGAAKGAAAGLPVNILQSAMAAPESDPQVIDYYVHHAACKDELIESVILNGATADQTIASLAATANTKHVDLIAENEQRVLRAPDIIAALYQNKAARMSTVDRVVELAVRNEIKVSGIPAWDEVCRSALQSASGDEPKLSAEAMDSLFEKAAPTVEVAEGQDDGEISVESPEEQEIAIRDMTIPMKIRLAMMGNKFQRGQLIRDPKKIVAMAVIKSPSVKENEAAKYASNNSLSEDVIGYIAAKKEWTKLYHIKLSLVQNPKCPLPSAMRLLPHLRPKDLQGIARSRNVPTALSAQAKKLNAARTSGKRR